LSKSRTVYRKWELRLRIRGKSDAAFMPLGPEMRTRKPHPKTRRHKGGDQRFIGTFFGVLVHQVKFDCALQFQIEKRTSQFETKSLRSNEANVASGIEGG
jgi:hypothetical protein